MFFEIEGKKRKMYDEGGGHGEIASG